MHIITPSDTFTRPADTTPYANGDLIANSTTAGSVVPLEFAISGIGRSGMIRRARVHLSSEVTTNATLNIRLFNESPTVTSGDNATLATTTNGDSYLGVIAVDLSAGLVSAGGGLTQVSAATAIGVSKPTPTGKIYALLEAAAGYTPESAEVFDVTLEIEG